MPMGDGTFGLGILKAIRAQAGADVGDTVAVVVERDEGERVVELPAELASALDGAPAAANAFRRLSYSHQREHAAYVAEAKKVQTRRDRAARVVSRLTV